MRIQKWPACALPRRHRSFLKEARNLLGSSAHTQPLSAGSQSDFQSFDAPIKALAALRCIRLGAKFAVRQAQRFTEQPWIPRLDVCFGVEAQHETSIESSKSRVFSEGKFTEALACQAREHLAKVRFRD